MGVYIKGLQAEKVEAIFKMLGLSIKDGGIIEVPEPHGRLIDADALVELEDALNTKIRGVHIMFVDDVKNFAPTIIEGSE